ncbi:MAG: hypothetical protein GTO18_11070 [Anaerolineales bacterium]|nr:hypothetical protein [Anaerolineales bacterium]
MSKSKQQPDTWEIVDNGEAPWAIGEDDDTVAGRTLPGSSARPEELKKVIAVEKAKHRAVRKINVGVLDQQRDLTEVGEFWTTNRVVSSDRENSKSASSGEDIQEVQS